MNDNIELDEARAAPPARRRPKVLLGSDLDRYKVAHPVWHEHWFWLFRLGMETAASELELMWSHRSDFDLAARIWNLDARRCGTGRSRRVPLTPRAVEIVQAMDRIADLSNERVFHALPGNRIRKCIFRQMALEMGYAFGTYRELRETAIREMIRRNPCLSMAVIAAIADRKTLSILFRVFKGAPASRRRAASPKA